MDLNLFKSVIIVKQITENGVVLKVSVEENIGNA